eukprot:TRINITY_DN6471_c0_g1_i12.p1 TRINITY_DN6471_c0_g1~~TRINITY_DN6471_c0_g1_i12.p1  ORF type:complete len:208 (-),score=-8.01 TRINITY_DN6471_c0_g1_i12:214-837(-)
MTPKTTLRRKGHDAAMWHNAVDWQWHHAGKCITLEEAQRRTWHNAGGKHSTRRHPEGTAYKLYPNRQCVLDTLPFTCRSFNRRPMLYAAHSFRSTMAYTRVQCRLRPYCNCRDRGRCMQIAQPHWMSTCPLLWQEDMLSSLASSVRDPRRSVATRCRIQHIREATSFHSTSTALTNRAVSDDTSLRFLESTTSDVRARASPQYHTLT